MRSRHVLLLITLLLGLFALVAAGCGGGSGPPGVASLGTDATTTSGSSGAPSGSGPSTSSGGGSGGQAMAITGGHNALKFSQCMRSHGVSNFPDPNGQGVIQFDPNSGIDPGSSTFQSAQHACQKLVGGGTPNPAEEAQARRQALAFSACMRKHGVPDFPDPTFSGGGIAIGGPNSNLNPNSPTFQAAQRACQGHLPKGAPKIGSSSGGK